MKGCDGGGEDCEIRCVQTGPDRYAVSRGTGKIRDVLGVGVG